MIALRVVLEDQLPVRPHIVIDPSGRAQLRQIPMSEFAGQRRKDFFQRRRLIRQTDEDETLPRAPGSPVQRVIRLIESRNLIHVRRADEAAIEPISPGMIRTLNRRRVSACLFAQPRPAMPADIVKAAHLRCLIPHDDQTLPRHFLDKIVARLGDLTLMPDTDPLPRERSSLVLRRKPRAKPNNAAARVVAPAIKVSIVLRKAGMAMRHTERDTTSSPRSVNRGLIQNRLMKFVPVVEIVQVYRVFRRRWRRRECRTPPGCPACFVIVDITPDRGVMFFDRLLVERFGVLASPRLRIADRLACFSSM